MKTRLLIASVVSVLLVLSSCYCPAQSVGDVYFDQQTSEGIDDIVVDGSTAPVLFGLSNGSEAPFPIVGFTLGDNISIVSGALTASSGENLPSQTGNSGKFLTTDGTDASWATISGGGDALVANPLSQFAATTSAQFAGVISDETGSGAVVLATSPTLTTPNLGTPSALTLTNATGLPWSTGLTGVPSEFTPAAHNQAWSTITSTPTTLAGYGITDALIYELKSADFTAVAGHRYAVDSSDNTVDITLPASPSAGDTVIVTGADTWSNIVTFDRNGEPINSTASDVQALSPSHLYLWVAVYVDETIGWVLRAYADTTSTATLFAPILIPLDYLSDTNVPQGFETDPADNEILAWDSGTEKWINQTAAEAGIGAGIVEIGIACSDETTDLTTGTGKVTFRMPYAMTLSEVRSSVGTAPVGSTFIIDINESGTTVLSTRLSIDASEKTSTTAATAAVISDSALANDAEITIDFDQVGSLTAGAGAKVWLIGTRN